VSEIPLPGSRNPLRWQELRAPPKAFIQLKSVPQQALELIHSPYSLLPAQHQGCLGTDPAQIRTGDPLVLTLPPSAS
jgi:hypothetical protein